MMKRLAARDISLEGRPGAFTGSLMNSSADLVARACQGDQEAFRLIFERYSRPVISFIYDQVGDRELADELTQETFVRAYRGLKSLRKETKLSTWLFGIAKNVARESLRARIRQSRHIDLDDKQVLDLSDQNPAPSSQLLDKEFNEVVQRSLALLDEDKRLVFTLKIFHQCSYEEIAEITGFSIPKLKTDLHRARAEMRQRVGQYVRN
ncbi:MAG TPA: sigma-70 family RNA polymerase sigma factor [Pyrinomonadaceae bacterium]|nr:sigma-70 family RNA polymerase sigma factor [Pyrinomonadaceae bacterium]